MPTSTLASTAERRVIRGVPSTPAGRPSVTVVIPAYNYARYLPDCAASALGQRDVDVRLVIVDDASTDGTPEVTDALAADPRVQVVRHERNRGHIPSVNEGLGLVETEYLVKLDADDLLAPGALARATALLDAHPDVGFAYGRPRHFSGPPPRPVDAPSRSWTVWSGRAWVAAVCRTAANVISQPEVVIRTAALRQIGPVREELPHTSDLNVWLKLAAAAEVGRINGPVQGYYREHEASMQRTVHAGFTLDFDGRRAAFEDAFAAEAGMLPGAEELHAAARRRLAESALDRACRAYDRGRTEEVPVDELVAFALEVWPSARDLRAWTALEHRRAVGAARAPHTPRFVYDAIARRAADEYGRVRWRHTGHW